MLAEREPDFSSRKNGYYLARITTAAWYNGRERGMSLCLQTDDPRTNCLYIAWSEHRVSDGIVVYNWEDEWDINPPTADSLSVETWEKNAHFNHGDVGGAAQHIYYLMENWWAKNYVDDCGDCR